MRLGRAFIIVLVLSSLSVESWAYIPPIRDLVENIFDKRRPEPAVVLQLDHRIQLPSGKQISISEEILRNGSRVLCLWKVSGYGSVIGGKREKQRYLAGGIAVPTRSQVFLRYFLYDTPSTLLGALVNERFVDKSQLQVYRPGYEIKGDPALWKTSENYIRHPGISLERLDRGIAIAVVGLNDSNLRKVVYFDKGFRGIERLEWREGQNLVAFNFASFSQKQGIRGWFPTRMSLAMNGTDRVVTTVRGIARANNKKIASFEGDLAKAQKSGELPAEVSESLALLLGFR